MSESHLWDLDQPAAHDPIFVLAVMERIERRRLWRSLVELSAGVLAVGVVSWALAPVAQALSSQPDTMLVTGILVSCITVAMIAHRALAD